MPAQRNHVMAAFLHLLGPEHSVRLVDRINRQFNQTKQVVLSDFSRTGGCIELRYLPGITHNTVITEQNLGCYVGTLELFGYQKVQGKVLQDHQAVDLSGAGYSRLQFQFQGESLWQRLRWLAGYTLAGLCCRTYLKSHHVFHRYHREVIDAFQAELNQKEQALALNQHYYQQLVNENTQRNSELERQVAERTASLTKEISTRQQLVQQLSAELHIPLTLMQQQLLQLQQHPDDAASISSCSKQLARSLNRLHATLLQLPDVQFQQDLLARPDSSAALAQDLHFDEKLQRMLQLHYAKADFNVSQLAQLLSCTERTLHRKAQQSCGKSPSALLRDYRINQAKLLLQHGSSIKDTAHLSGFSSVSYFSASFKKAAGITPADYLKQGQHVVASTAQ
ncbi:helix-turn-helix transcriptional regulator [Arsukibacterium sp.]|uniref:helix-turn-helix transcriptional regulator n=1 Tax=Arsukibacterium sp. TaxID=1977258 RepID=UPI002FDA7BBD